MPNGESQDQPEDAVITATSDAGRDDFLNINEIKEQLPTASASKAQRLWRDYIILYLEEEIPTDPERLQALVREINLFAICP